MTVYTDDPARAHLLRRRFEERQRLSEFKRRLAETDPGRHPRAADAIHHAILTSAEQLAAIETELAGEVVMAATDDLNAEEGRHQMRARLHHLELVLQRHAPPSCKRAASNLRRAIHTELRRLDADQTRGRVRS